MNFYPDNLYVNFDGNNSSATSTTTTPHGTLTRMHVNNVKMNPMSDHHGNGITTPGMSRAKLKSPSQHSFHNGRTSSVTALSERSMTGGSLHGSLHPSERVGLLTQQQPPP
jgi:hypothetical protein